MVELLMKYFKDKEWEQEFETWIWNQFHGKDFWKTLLKNHQLDLLPSLRGSANCGYNLNIKDMIDTFQNKVDTAQQIL